MNAARLPPALLALSPGNLAPRDGRFLAQVAAAARAGLRGVLLREGELGDRDYLELAGAVRGALAPWPEAWLGVHDRAHLARAATAQGVHLGGRSLAPSAVRPWLDAAVALGFSSHAGDDPRSWSGCDYLVHAPFGDVPHKGPGVGASGIQRAVRLAACPVWALGGIAPADVAAILAAGAAGVVVRRGIFDAPDCARAVGDYLAALAAARP